MQLIKARVQNYKSVEDSGWVDFDQVTCLVGKNESGKTAFLQAIEKINPVDSAHSDFDYVYDYPSAKYTAYKRTHETKPAPVVTVEFKLDPEDYAAVEEKFGKDALPDETFTVTKLYSNSSTWSLSVNRQAAIQAVAAPVFGQSEALDAAIKAASTGKELADALAAHGDGVEPAQRLAEEVAQWPSQDVWQAICGVLSGRLPRFFYFDDYSVMKGRISLDDLIRRLDSAGVIEDHERPFLALLSMIGASAHELRDEMHSERLTRELEGASVHITDEMFEFWKQNDRLEVRFERKEADPNDPAPLNEGKVLGVRIYNPNHRASVPFDQRSKGFVWFFSFLVFFQQMEESKTDAKTILLLDEPALSLHALAQRDFLRFIDERLAPEHQVLYTTHSPFMVEPTKFTRVRTVHDRGRNGGTVVSDEVYRTDSDTIFPLQAALGYDLAQTLFVGPDNLLVEGPSDMIYLDVLNAAVAAKGGETLNDRWVKVPVGGADKLYTFVTLLGGNQLNAIALMDVSKRDIQRVQNLQSNGHLPKNGLIQISEITGGGDADIEDLFTPAFYLKLVNGAYAKELPKKITANALGEGSPRIVARIEKYFQNNDIADGSFSHFLPASYLSREQGKLIGVIDDATIARAEHLFGRINTTLS